MKYTLLELVQRILESMESDEVSDINETPEATTVANIVRECYYDIVGELNMQEQRGLFKLDASGDNLLPCMMLMPSVASRLHWLKYNINDTLGTPTYRDIYFVSNEEFLFRQDGFNPDETNVSEMSVPLENGTFVFKFRNDAHPTYFTIFDESNFVFDSYDVSVESTLTQARTTAFGDLVPSFTMSNTWIADLDPRQFQLLLQDAKATAFVELKQSQNPTAEKKARKNRILTQKNKNDNDPSTSAQSRYTYGRRGVTFPQLKRAMRQGV